MYGRTKDELRRELDQIRASGLRKGERIITTRQGSGIEVGGTRVLNFCANNYLGLTSHPAVIAAARRTLDEWGYGLSSVRFICGTQEIHKNAERKVADYLGMDDAILFASCYDANLGVFQPLLGADDAIIADELNHASIIDGVRLSKARRLIYDHGDMNDLERKLRDASSAGRRLICTDGVFSMDGDVARLDEICDLADRYDSLLMVDDSHATGLMGETGRGTHEHHGCMERVDIITTTFGKALGGASGGCVAARAEIVEYLRQKARPYLFSNTVAPAVLGATIAVIDLLSQPNDLLPKLRRNTRRFRDALTQAGFDIVPGDHPIVPVMFGGFPNDAQLAQDFAADLLDEGIYVIGFSYPVVPRGQARIRVQISAAHEPEHLDTAIEAFTKVGVQRGVL